MLFGKVAGATTAGIAMTDSATPQGLGLGLILDWLIIAGLIGGCRVYRVHRVRAAVTASAVEAAVSFEIPV